MFLRVDHQSIDAELRKLRWICEDEPGFKITTYYAYGLPDVSYEFSYRQVPGKSKYDVLKTLPSGRKLRLLNPAPTAEAAEGLARRDFALRHDHFQLTWESSGEKPSGAKSFWCKWWSRPPAQHIQPGTICTGKYQGQPAVKIILQERKASGGYRLRAQHIDESDCAPGLYEFFHDLKSLPEVLEKFKKTARTDFKIKMENRQIDFGKRPERIRVPQARARDGLGGS